MVVAPAGGSSRSIEIPVRAELRPFAAARSSCWSAGAATADAQVTITGGPAWLGGHPIGTADAELRTNAPGAVTPPFTLFTVDSRIAPSVVGAIRVGVEVRSGFTVEGWRRVRPPAACRFRSARDPEAGAATIRRASPCSTTSLTPALTWDLRRPRGEPAAHVRPGWRWIPSAIAPGPHARRIGPAVLRRRRRRVIGYRSGRIRPGRSA